MVRSLSGIGPRPSWLFDVGFGAVALRLRDGWPDRATNPIASARRASNLSDRVGGSVVRTSRD